MLEHKYDFVVLFDVTNGNPNGDPDAGNDPRTDAETGYGFVTDVCIKRKIRNYVDLVKDEAPGYKILIRNDRPLNDKFKDAYVTNGLPVDTITKKGTNPSVERQARDFMCRNYYDVRVFGAVMSTGDHSCGIVRGPVQLGFAESVSPVYINNVTITRQAKTDEERAKKSDTEFGNKNVIPYGLYRLSGHISAALANKETEMTEDDVELLWNALLNMFEEDRSAARGDMEVRGLYIFEHDSVLGNARFCELENHIKVSKRPGIVAPRKYEDYEVTIEEKNLPEGVTLICK